MAQYGIPNIAGNLIAGYESARQVKERSRLAELDQIYRDRQLSLQERNLAGDEAYRDKSFTADQQYRQDSLALQRDKMNEPTADVQQYNLARGQGFKGSFMDYQLALKKAGGTNISIDQRGESEFSKVSGKLDAEYFSKVAEGGQDAQNMIGAVNQLRDIGSRITTGKTTEILTALGPYANAVGIKIEGLDDAQAFDAVVARIAPQMRVPGSGATSDFEMQMFLKSLPGLGKTPGGNELIQGSLESIAQYRRKAAEIATQAKIGRITRQDALAQIQALPDPLTLWKQAGGDKLAKGGGGAQQQPQGGSAAPGGEITIDLDGNIVQ